MKPHATQAHIERIGMVRVKMTAHQYSLDTMQDPDLVARHLALVADITQILMVKVLMTVCLLNQDIMQLDQALIIRILVMLGLIEEILMEKLKMTALRLLLAIGLSLELVKKNLVMLGLIILVKEVKVKMIACQHNLDTMPNQDQATKKNAQQAPITQMNTEQV